MKSAIDTTTNAQERIEFAFNAINNLEGQNLESILSNKEKVTNIIPTWCILTIIFQGLIIFGYLYLRIFYV